MMTRDEAQALMDEVDIILDEVPSDDRGDMGAVNWADLRCVDVELRQSLVYGDDATMRIVIMIEEASPNAQKLCDYVAMHLHPKWGPAVSIETEW
jgi:hypothetical protein